MLREERAKRMLVLAGLGAEVEKARRAGRWDAVVAERRAGRGVVGAIAGR